MKILIFVFCIIASIGCTAEKESVPITNTNLYEVLDISENKVMIKSLSEGRYDVVYTKPWKVRMYHTGDIIKATYTVVDRKLYYTLGEVVVYSK